MINYTKSFAVTGVANTEVLDTGLESTAEEKKTLKSIFISVSGLVGNLVVGWLEREKIVDIYDYVLNTHEASGTNAYKSVNKIIEIPIDLAIPEGQTFKIGVKCGGTAKDIYGAYVYTIA